MRITTALHQELDPERALHWEERIAGSILKLDNGEEVKANHTGYRTLRIHISAEADRMIEILSDMKAEGFFE